MPELQKKRIETKQVRTWLFCLMNTHSQPEVMEAHAAECRRLADVASDREARLTYLELAEGWEDLARLRRRLEADKQWKRSIEP